MTDSTPGRSMSVEKERDDLRETLTYISRWLNDDLTQPPTDDRDVRAIVNIAREALQRTASNQEGA